MRTGIIILPDLEWSQARSRWRGAEEYGFDHAWTYDHLGWRDLADGPWFDAVTTLTAAATVTCRIRLGTMVASPNFRNPVHFARELTALDDISGGRMTLGVGVGGAGFDAKVLGGPELTRGERVSRFGEFLQLLDLLLSNDRTTWQGDYYAALDARSTPGCVQSPRLPFVVAAGGPRTARLAEQYGAGWVTTGDDETEGIGLEGWWRSVTETVKRFEDALDSAGRHPDEMDRYLSLDAAPVFSLSSAAYFADAAHRAAGLGFTDVMTHWPRSSSWYKGDESVLDEVAADVLPALKTI